MADQTDAPTDPAVDAAQPDPAADAAVETAPTADVDVSNMTDAERLAAAHQEWLEWARTATTDEPPADLGVKYARPASYWADVLARKDAEAAAAQATAPAAEVPATPEPAAAAPADSTKADAPAT